MAILKIALLQIDAAETLEATLEKGLLACRRAKTLGADIALFPEIWSHGYRFFDENIPAEQQRWRASALSLNGRFIAAHRETAKELGMAIGTSLLEKGDHAPRNTFVLIDRTGDIALVYAKVHTCLHSLERYCEPGTGFKVVSLETAKGPVMVGAMICYDREFPEPARVLALKGAEIVLVPNACHFDRHRLEQLKVRAFENKIALAMTNYPATSQDGNGKSVGISAVAYRNHGPDRLSASGSNQSYAVNNLVVEAGPAEQIAIFDIDLDDLRHYREHAIWGATHRRPQTYTELTKLHDPIHLDPTQLIS